MAEWIALSYFQSAGISVTEEDQDVDYDETLK